MNDKFHQNKSSLRFTASNFKFHFQSLRCTGFQNPIQRTCLFSGPIGIQKCSGNKRTVFKTTPSLVPLFWLVTWISQFMDCHPQAIGWGLWDFGSLQNFRKKAWRITLYNHKWLIIIASSPIYRWDIHIYIYIYIHGITHPKGDFLTIASNIGS